MRLTVLQSILAFLGRLVLGHAKATVVQAIASLENSNSPLLQYPTQFTQGIVPKQIHSHNDCEYPFSTGSYAFALGSWHIAVRWLMERCGMGCVGAPMCFGSIVPDTRRPGDANANGQTGGMCRF